MERLSDIKNFSCFKLTTKDENLDFFYTADTFVNVKGELFQNCTCGKCSACFRTKNNMKNKIGKLDDVTEVTFED